jgi:hypothetical protein
MKSRIAIWAGAGFLVACCWVLYTFLTPPDQLNMSLREPVTEAVLFISCPVVFALRNLPLAFWWVPPINAATYAVIGLVVEILRRKLNFSLTS